MVAYSLVQRLTPNLALAGAGLAGALVALATLAIPGPLLEDMVLTSGIAAFIPAAEPPLGATARICVGVFAGGAVALIAWFLLSALVAWRDSRARAPDEGRPVVRRADAHPDAPPRPPLLATRDLGMPFPKVEQVDVETREIARDAVVSTFPLGEVESGDAEVCDLDLPELPPEPVIAMGASAAPPARVSTVDIPEPRMEASPPTPQPLPADLDQPLSAFDPAAIPEVPMSPPPPLPPLVRQPRPPVYAASERFETFELAPTPRPAAAPPAAPRPDSLAAPETDASVQALLDRLEQGIARRGQRETAPEAPPPAPPPPAPPPQHASETEFQGLEGALEALRKLAVRV